MGKQSRERNRMRRWLSKHHGVELSSGVTSQELCEAVECQFGIDLGYMKVSQRMAVLQRKCTDGPKSKKIKDAKKIQKKVDWAKFAASPAFLETYAWKKLRYRALKACGSECLACGRGREDGAKLHVDHIKSRKTHPHLALDIRNVQVLCGDCNHGKGNWDSTDWRD